VHRLRRRVGLHGVGVKSKLGGVEVDDELGGADVEADVKSVVPENQKTYYLCRNSSSQPSSSMITCSCQESTSTVDTFCATSVPYQALALVLNP
jgi:hypothetical protein